jgi:hypothetical protein
MLFILGWRQTRNIWTDPGDSRVDALAPRSPQRWPRWLDLHRSSEARLQLTSPFGEPVVEALCFASQFGPRQASTVWLPPSGADHLGGPETRARQGQGIADREWLDQRSDPSVPRKRFGRMSCRCGRRQVAPGMPLAGGTPVPTQRLKASVSRGHVYAVTCASFGYSRSRMALTARRYEMRFDPEHLLAADALSAIASARSRPALRLTLTPLWPGAGMRRRMRARVGIFRTTGCLAGAAAPPVQRWLRRLTAKTEFRHRSKGRAIVRPRERDPILLSSPAYAASPRWYRSNIGRPIARTPIANIELSSTWAPLPPTSRMSRKPTISEIEIGRFSSDGHLFAMLTNDPTTYVGPHCGWMRRYLRTTKR